MPGDRTPDETQRQLNRAVWDPLSAMRVVRQFTAATLDHAARRRGLAVGAIDETGQVKQEEDIYRHRCNDPLNPGWAGSVSSRALDHGHGLVARPPMTATIPGSRSAG